MKAFIAMPFDKDFDKYWDVIQEVGTKNKVKLFRVDRNLSFERHIDIAIRREIEQADFMIAMLTGDKVKEIPNPNVAFEIGYAQGIGMETILMADKADSLPFDFKQQRACIYNDDMDLFREGLTKEIKLLKEMIDSSYSKNLKVFFNEIIRCLRIILPSEYKLFKEERGYIDDGLWLAIYYGEKKRYFRYAIHMKNLSKATLSCWLSDYEYRRKQKEFFKENYELLQKHLGYDINMNFKERTNEKDSQLNSAKSENFNETRNKEFIKEVMEIERKSPSTKEALEFSLRIKDYVEAFEPLNKEFKEKYID